MTPQATKQNDQESVPEGYPYSPAELWRRIIEVVRTPPDELTYQKFGQIWDLEFDEEKISWLGDRSTKKYFRLATQDIKKRATFPFGIIAFHQSDPFISENILQRGVSFTFELFTRLGPEIQSRNFCLYPKISDIESLGYTLVHDDAWPPPVPDYKTYHYSANIANPKNSGTLWVDILHNGCVFGVSYTKYVLFQDN